MNVWRDLRTILCFAIAAHAAVYSGARPKSNSRSYSGLTQPDSGFSRSQGFNPVSNPLVSHANPQDSRTYASAQDAQSFQSISPWNSGFSGVGSSNNYKYYDVRKMARNFGRSDSEKEEVDTILSVVNSLMNSKSGKSQSIPEKKKSVKFPPSNPLPKPLANQVAKVKLDYYKRKRKDKPGQFLDDLWHEDRPEETGQHFEGDIVLFKEQAEALLDEVIHEGQSRRKRKFIRNALRKWDPAYPIEFSFDGSHGVKEQEYIELALQHWQNITCLNFQKVAGKPTGNRIVFTDVDGCASNVGRHPLGEPQFVSIAQECLRLGVIAHEVAHALGFWHEQSRPDRDEHVTVLWNNIEYGSAGQFTKELLEDVDSSGIEYDYGSVMHYRSKAFSRSDDLFTISTNVGDYQRTIGQRDQLSFNDIKLMNAMYCKHACPTRLPCQRGGYTDPRQCSRCRCPDGFTGRLCETVMRGYGHDCGGVVEVGHGSAVIISSPGYPEYFKKGQECSWLLKAPAGMHIKLEFRDRFDLYCKPTHSLCMDYIEIRNSTDFANTGMRYCCYNAPRQPVFSSTNEMLVLFRSFYQKGRGFQAVVSAVSSSGSFREWGSWSECSASCGGCGTRIRHRLCGSEFCSGKASQVESCNDNVCAVCDKPSTFPEVVPCGLWGLFRCRKVAQPANCADTCCPGYVAQNGRCVPHLLR